MNRLRYITRVENDRQHCWVVRVQRMVDGKRVLLHGRSVYDATQGGKRKALEAAIAYRDGIAGSIPPARNLARPPGDGYVKKGLWQGRGAWFGWVRLEDRRVGRTKVLIDVWGPRVAKRMAEAWLEAHRRAIRARARAALKRAA